MTGPLAQGSRSLADASPRVTIGMPVRNGEAFIRGGIEALLGQTYTDLALVISDNASTDATQAICEAVAREDPRVRYQRLDHNVGLHANFARLIDEANGPYFMWACHDDWWDPTYVERMVDVLDTQPDVVIAGSNAASFDQQGIRHHVFDNAAVYGRPAVTAARVRRFLAEPPGNGHATMMYGVMRSSVAREIGYAPPGAIYDTDRGYYGMDLLFLLRLLLRGGFHVEPDVLYCRRDVRWSRRQWVEHDQAWGERDRLAASMRTMRAAHGYFGDVRRILEDSELDDGARRALIRATYREELRFHPRTLAHLVGRTRKRLARRLDRSPA